MTAWNVTTAVLANTKSVNAQDPSPLGIFFRPNGLKMYIIGNPSDRVFEYNLSSAWNIAAAVLFQSFSIATQTILPTGLFFRSDGLKMYITSESFPSFIYEYNLSSAWNIATISFLQSFTITAQDTTPTGLFIRDDGLKMYVAGGGNDRIYEYNLTTPWSISTAYFFQGFLQ